jgi:hypothetical protein
MDTDIEQQATIELTGKWNDFIKNRKFWMLLVPVFAAIGIWIGLPEFGYILDPVESIAIFGAIVLLAYRILDGDIKFNKAALEVLSIAKQIQDSSESTENPK